MTRAILAAAACAAITLLSACGGGGGDSGGDDSGAAEPYKLTFSEATLTASATSGVASTVAIEATVDRPIPEQVNVVIVDPDGMFQPSVTLTALSATRYRVQLTTVSSLEPARYRGSVEVRLCRDATPACTSPIAGSPWKVPYDIVIERPAYTVEFPTATIAVEGYLGELGATTFGATLTATPDAEAVYPKVVDPSGRFTAGLPSSVPILGSTTFRASLLATAALAPGDHEGTLELHLCRNPACTSEYPGSPVLRPYTLKVLPATHLTALAPLAGAGEWAMHQGNAAHTGHVPVTLDASRFNRRWRWFVEGPASASGHTGTTVVTPAVTADGRLYVGRSNWSEGSTLYALNENDASRAWSHEFGLVFALNPPAVAGGKVFAATSGHQDTAMWTFAADSGTQFARLPFDSQWEHYYAPAVEGGAVYTNAGYYGGLLSMDAATGTRNWFLHLPQYDNWTPAADATQLYALVAGNLYVIDKATGVVGITINNPTYDWNGYDMDSAPMLGAANRVITKGGSVYLNTTNRLLGFDLASRTLAWSAIGRYANSPATAGSVVYATSDTTLEARDVSDGTLRWAWSLPVPGSTFSTAESNVIVTDNLAFVSSESATYAVDLTTHQTVWQHPVGGQLALSPRGLLYIVQAAGGHSRGSVVAINLR